MVLTLTIFYHHATITASNMLSIRLHSRRKPTTGTLLKFLGNSLT